MNINLQEILSCHDWAIEPIAGRQLYDALMKAIASQDGIDKDDMAKTEGYFLSKNRSFAGKLFVGNIHRIEDRLYWNDEELAEDDQIVNVVMIRGTVTRNGGACTYGSKDHRDQILYANTIPQVVGHILFIDTPGGMVSAMPDYAMAFENCRELGKPTVAHIDGMCYSAGVWIASQCDRVIVRNPEDGIGCIGAMSCGMLAPHGSINAITQERLFILVGKASPDKNREAIEAAGGNYELMQAEADKNTERFHSVVKANRPMVTDDLLTGKTFAASETMGKLVDEIGDMNRAIAAVFELADGRLTPARSVVAMPEDPERDPEDENPEDGEPEQIGKLTAQQKAFIAANPDAAAEINDGHVTVTKKGPFGLETTEVAKPQNNTDMKQEQEEKKNAQEAAAAEAPQEGKAQENPEEGTPAQENPEEGAPAQEAPEENAPAQEAPEQEASEGDEGDGTTKQPEAQAVTETIEEIDKILNTLHDAEAKIAEKDSAIAGYLAKIEEMGKTIAEKDATIASHVKTIDGQTGTIEALTKQVADLKAEVKELSGKPAPMLDAAAGAPAGNGTGEAPQVGYKKRITRENMTYEHCRKVALEREAERRAAKQ